MIPRLHVLVGGDELEGPGGLGEARRLLERLGPRVAVHLRARVPPRALTESARELVEAAMAAGGWCVVNGRLDVALAAGAHAVQLGSGAIAPADARALIEQVGGRLQVGVSVHGAAESERAAEGGAHYLVLGTIFATPSHPGRAGRGAGLIRAARVRLDLSGRADVPLLAIGGLGADRLGEVMDAGAHGIVVQRAVWSAVDSAAAALDLAQRLEDRE